MCGIPSGQFFKNAGPEGRILRKQVGLLLRLRLLPPTTPPLKRSRRKTEGFLGSNSAFSLSRRVLAGISIGRTLVGWLFQSRRRRVKTPTPTVPSVQVVFPSLCTFVCEVNFHTDYSLGCKNKKKIKGTRRLGMFPVCDCSCEK